ncbi:MAG: hypothetical protein K8R52_00815 [Bacteroidales bacterium]|nr:hypothetical protein [Bacteroidales bacterium]
MNRFTVAVLLLFFMALPAFSQESDTVQKSDTVYAIQNSDSIYRFGQGDLLITDTLLSQPLKIKSPTRALMYALVLPGLGQAYNEKYYKMPIVWAALGGAGYAIVYNTKVYRQATIEFLEGDLDERYLPIYRRNMELSYIAAIAIYGLQILDAYVDAHLYSWDVNDNLSLGISPSLQPMMAPSSVTGYSGGLTCSFKIRGR